jgi:glutathione peroxidase
VRERPDRSIEEDMHRHPSLSRFTGLSLLMLAGCSGFFEEKAVKSDAAAMNTIHSFKVQTLENEPVELASYKGKVLLVVNTASECGFTPQYEGLENLQREMKGKAFNVLGFPSNDFGGQEPGTAQEIATFCKLTYDVDFPMFEKLVTKPGAGQSPIYSFLGKTGNLPAWNFAKYVVDKTGKVIAFFPSQVTPEAPELRNAIAKALAAN